MTPQLGNADLSIPTLSYPSPKISDSKRLPRDSMACQWGDESTLPGEGNALQLTRDVEDVVTPSTYECLKYEEKTQRTMDDGGNCVGVGGYQACCGILDEFYSKSYVPVENKPMKPAELYTPCPLVTDEQMRRQQAAPLGQRNDFSNTEAKTIHALLLKCSQKRGPNSPFTQTLSRDIERAYSVQQLSQADPPLAEETNPIPVRRAGCPGNGTPECNALDQRARKSPAMPPDEKRLAYCCWR